MIGGKDVTPTVNMGIDDNQFTFHRKFEGKFKTKGQRAITSFLLPKDTEQFLPYGLALLFCEEKPTQLRLSLNEKSKKVTSEIKDLLKKSIIDLVVYGATAISDRCSIFEELCPDFVIPYRRQYMVREINAQLIDLSINRCTLRTNGFLPESFRLGHPTPGERNDCTGERLFLENEATIHEVQEDRLPADLPSLVNKEIETEEVATSNLCMPSQQPFFRYTTISEEMVVYRKKGC